MPFSPLRADDPRQIGPYRLVGQLGAGGMGIVYLARTRGGTPVALKLIRPEFAADETFRARFTREVEVGQRVNGVCIARYLDADPLAERPYLVTEYVDGPGLGDVVSRRGPFSGPQLQALAAGLAEGLVSLHRAGVVHRDLKPSNVLLARDAPKIIDFGIAHAGDATSMTRTGHVVGSAGWMSPEQAVGAGVTTAGDVFAWASVMTYAATGRPPFGEGQPAAVIYRVVHQDPDVAGVPAELRVALDRAFAKDPADRPSPAELLAMVTATSATGSGDDIHDVLGVAWVPVEPLEADAAAEAQAALARPDTTAGARSDAPSNQTVALVVAAVLALVAGAVIAWAVLRDDGGSGQATPSTTAVPVATTEAPPSTSTSTSSTSTSTSSTSTSTSTSTTTTAPPEPESAWSAIEGDLPPGSASLLLADAADGPVALSSADRVLAVWFWSGTTWQRTVDLDLPAAVDGPAALSRERLTGARNDDVLVRLDDQTAAVVALGDGTAELVAFEVPDSDETVEAIGDASAGEGRVTGSLDGVDGDIVWRYDPATDQFAVEQVDGSGG